MEKHDIVSTSPHLASPMTTSKEMWLVVWCLLPTAVASVIIFGIPSLIVIATCVISCVVVEMLSCLAFGKDVATVKDGSAVVTGVLLAFNLPPSSPFWMVIIGGIVAILLVKQIFGGLGYNIFNPALAARAVLLASWPVAMTTWMKPVNTITSLFGLPHAAVLNTDAITSATALGIIKESEGLLSSSPYSHLELLFGTVPGSLGETCKITLLLGAIVLFAYKVIDWRIPVTYIGTVFLLSIPFGRDPLAEVLSGGLILGALYMATDLVTCPTTNAGRILCGLSCGLLTALIRCYGGFPEGVCYSILIMNCMNPLIDKYVTPRVFGTTKKA